MLKHFHRGSATYKCRVCTRLCRATLYEHGGGEDGICSECWDLAGIENSILDYGLTEAAENRKSALPLLKSLKKKNAPLKNWMSLMKTLDIPLEAL